MNSDTSDFLAVLLELHNDADRTAAWSVHEFHPEFTAAVETFITGFEEYLLTCREKLREAGAPEDDVDRLDPFAATGTWGGSIFLSLSGAGAGLQDDSETEDLHAALMDYSGDRHRFEGIDLYKFKGKIHLAYRTAAFRREYLAKLFTVAGTPAAV